MANGFNLTIHFFFQSSTLFDTKCKVYNQKLKMFEAPHTQSLTHSHICTCQTCPNNLTVLLNMIFSWGASVNGDNTENYLKKKLNAHM